MLGNVGMSRVLSLAALAVLEACGPSSSVNQPAAGSSGDGESIPPTIAFQEGDVVVGRAVYFPCPAPLGGWRMDWLPAGDPVTLDLYFIRQSADVAFPTWSLDDLRDVSDAGGAVLRRFNMGVIRARLDRAAVARLHPHSARIVPMPDRYDVQVSVGSDQPAVRERFEQLGGVITRVSENVGAFHGVVPDDAIPDLRTMPSVRYIHHRGEGGCLHG